MASQEDLWPLPINWRGGWTEDYEFNTEVLTSRDQSEQRRALRKTPRVSYELLSTLRADAAQQAKRRLAARQAKQWVIPHGRLWTRLSADVPIGTVNFTLDDDPAWMAVGAEMVFRRAADAELGKAATYSAGVGTLDGPATALIPAGTPVHLGVRGRFETRAQLRLATTTVGEIVLKFLAEPGGHHVPPAGAAVETYNGKEVWGVRPNWARALSLDYEAFQDVIDFGFGVRGYVDPVDFVARTIQGEFHIDSGNLTATYGLFIRSRGKAVDLYLPSWNKELVPTAITTADMTIAGTELADLLGADPAHKHVVLFLKNGTKLLRGAASLAAVGGDSVLTFDTAIPAIGPDDIQYATWLLNARFFADRLRLEWVTNEAAVATVSFLSLRDAV